MLVRQALYQLGYFLSPHIVVSQTYLTRKLINLSLLSVTTSEDPEVSLKGGIKA